MMRWLVPCFAAALVLPTANASAQDKVGVVGSSFLNSPPSARSWGMGRTGAAIEDPFTGFLNPGGLAVYAGSGSAGLYRSDLQHGYLTNTIVFAGVPILTREQSQWPALSLAFAYQRSSLEESYPYTTYEHPYGSGDEHTLTNRSNNFTASVCLEKTVALGIGGTVKSFTGKYEGTQDNTVSESGTAYDLGVFTKVPLLAILDDVGFRGFQPKDGAIRPEIELVTSYAWVSRGDPIESSDHSSDLPLPQVDRFGRAVAVVLQHRDARVARFILTRDDEIFHSIEERRQGWELDLLGVFQLRHGSYWVGRSSNKSETEGWSVHLRGLLDWLNVSDRKNTDSQVPWYVRGLDVSYETVGSLSGDDTFPDFQGFGVMLDLSPLFDQ
jgi:hypothetical protein